MANHKKDSDTANLVNRNQLVQWIEAKLNYCQREKKQAVKRLKKGDITDMPRIPLFAQYIEDLKQWKQEIYNL